VTLYYLEDLPVKEIAIFLDIPEGTVKSRLYRAREELQSLLSNNEGGHYHYE
jgi:RNA polymerase sigma-70 factor (ECF subfamily)